MLSISLVVDFLFFLFFFFLNIYTIPLNWIRAKKRSAWRHDRLRTLEQEAAAAQRTIHAMNMVQDDSTKKNEVSDYSLFELL